MKYNEDLVVNFKEYLEGLNWELESDPESNGKTIIIKKPIKAKIWFYSGSAERASDDGKGSMQIRYQRGKGDSKEHEKVESDSEYKYFFLFYLSGIPDSASDGNNKLAHDISKYIYSLEAINTSGIGCLKNYYERCVKYFEEHDEEKFVRIQNDDDKKFEYITAISIQDEKGEPDFTKLKEYIEVFDNRPYRKKIYNTVKYIRSTESSKEGENYKKVPHNWLISGAPGTGKSYFLNEEMVRLLTECNSMEELINKLIAEDKSDADEQIKRDCAKQKFEEDYCKYYKRVTFYEDYMYENFVGCYKPEPEKNGVVDISCELFNGEKNNDDSGEVVKDNLRGTVIGDKIIYKFVPGPFIELLCSAIKEKDHNYLLVIEELNRAKAASVFGDIFLLLDRNPNGESTYFITPNRDLDNYLRGKLDESDYDGRLRLPKNFYIWATMNSADQGVFFVDSAFKRRWNYKLMNVMAARKGKQNEITLKYGKRNIKVLWDSFRYLINKKIAKVAEEDSFIGPWYFSDDELNAINCCAEGKNKKDGNPLVDKLFLYLRQDVFRNDPNMIFKEKDVTMSFLMNQYYDENGVCLGENAPAIETILAFDDADWENLFKDGIESAEGNVEESGSAEESAEEPDDAEGSSEENAEDPDSAEENVEEPNNAGENQEETD